MGWDINGWVEVQHIYEWIKPPHDHVWYGVIKIDNVVHRCFDMFSSLFGIAAFAEFTPVAPHRGLPRDISDEASADYVEEECVSGETWISWPEIASIDWSEDALDSRSHRYRRDSEGELVYEGKGGARASDIIEAGNTWQVGETIYRVERISRQSAVTKEWALLFHLMETLAAAYGGENVRLVVRFDY